MKILNFETLDIEEHATLPEPIEHYLPVVLQPLAYKYKDHPLKQRIYVELINYVTGVLQTLLYRHAVYLSVAELEGLFSKGAPFVREHLKRNIGSKLN